jgi:predicted Zn-dependent protease
MKRRDLLVAGCAQCAGLWALNADAAGGDNVPGAPSVDDHWLAPARFARPDMATDEAGLWAMMDRAEASLRRSPFLMRDSALRDYLKGVACKLGGGHCADIRVYPVRTPFFNASMAPNGMLQIWSGLLLRVDNEAQLAAVLGHEIGHYLQRHTLDRLRDAKARSAFAIFMVPFGAVGLLGAMIAGAGAFGFSRDQERQADAIGLTLMRQSGYDPREASKIWSNLMAERKARPGGDETSPMFATQPPSDERSAALARLAQDATGGVLGEREYAAAIAPFQRDLLDDELRRGQHGETLVLLDRLVQRDPQRADLLYYRAETRRLRAQGSDLDDAMTDLNRAVALGHEPPQVHRCIGYILQKRDQLPGAQSAFAHYLELAPDAPDASLIRTYLADKTS